MTDVRSAPQPDADERLARVNIARAPRRAARHRRALSAPSRSSSCSPTRRATSDWLSDLGICEPVDGSVGAVRDRRRAGRAADDRRRVRPLGRRDDRQLGPPARPADDARPTGTSGRRSRSCCCSAMAIGFINGYTVVQDEAAELHRHARDVLHPPGRERRRHAQDHRHRRDQRHRRAPGLRLGATVLRLDGLVALRLQGQRDLVDRAHGARRVAARAHALRQLDLRRRRRSRGRAQRRRAGRAHEDRALHDDLDDRGAARDHHGHRAARRSRPTRASGASSSSSSRPSSAAAC